MTFFFIHIKDIRKNTEYIYNHRPLSMSDLSKFVRQCCIQIQANEPEKVYNFKIFETSAEILVQKEVTHHGWVWNSKEFQQEVVYTVRAIPIFQMDVGLDCSTQTDFEDQISLHESDDSSIQSEVHFTVGTGYSNHILFPWKHQLVTELKDKLAITNFGLRNINSDLFDDFN
jgi:hypothetical protein